MKKFTKFAALFIAVIMCVSVFAACGSSKTNQNQNANNDNGNNQSTKILSVGYSPFNSKFSPFFSETAYDQDVWYVTQLPLLPSDRTGAVLKNSTKGETVNYNGTDYTYYGASDVVVTENEDGTVYYDFTLRDDLKFSDGEPVTIDDVIFTMYVYSDPTYDGSTTFYALPIEGMEDYRSDIALLIDLLYEAGRDNTDFTNWDEATQTAFWADYDKAALGLAEEIVNSCVENGYAEEGDIQGAADAWGFEAAENTLESFAAALQEAYGADVAKMINTEAAGSSVEDLFPTLDNYKKPVQIADPVANITGIQKTGDYTMRVVLTKLDATAIYNFTISIAPLHYYGDKTLYDYDNNKFGFTKGDLSIVRDKTTQPLGAGPYKFIEFKDNIVKFEANENYFLGTPKTKYMNFVQCNSDDDKLNNVKTGTVDITDPSFSEGTVESIKAANGNDSTTGKVITTSTVDNLGYGYIGICADVVNVGGDKGSDASKALRTAFATIFSAYRDVSIDSYYGERASVINYPISNTSWAAPQPSDEDYEIAFSKDVDGNPIYTDGMSNDEKYAAALKAALGFFEKAGYTVTDGKVTAAPEGASLEYEAWIPADGTGDHPSFMIFDEASKALETIGITLHVKDLSDATELWTSLESKDVAIWAAAWGATVDPDMYQVYFSGDDKGNVAGGSNYQYGIDDQELNAMILDARSTEDQAYRKAAYKACLDKIIEWAVEIPTYQRLNAVIFSTERVNISTVTPDITPFYPWLSEVYNVELN